MKFECMFDIGDIVKIKKEDLKFQRYEQLDENILYIITCIHIRNNVEYDLTISKYNSSDSWSGDFLPSELQIVQKRRKFGDDKYNKNIEYLDQYDLSMFIAEDVSTYYIVSAIRREFQYINQGDFYSDCFRFMNDDEILDYLSKKYNCKVETVSDYRKVFIKNK